MAENIWITGVSGFSGQYMVQHIRSVAPNARITGIGRNNPKPANVDKFLNKMINNIRSRHYII